MLPESRFFNSFIRSIFGVGKLPCFVVAWVLQVRRTLQYCANLGLQKKVNMCLRTSVYSAHTMRNRNYALHFLERKYLLSGMPTANRAECFIRHHQKLESSLPSFVLRRLMASSICVQEMQIEEHSISIHLGYFAEAYREGELALQFVFNGVHIYELCFTIVPGYTVGEHSRDVLLISRLQGNHACYMEQIKATKCVHENSLSSVLLSALQGVALAFNISTMVGVRSVLQPSFHEPLKHRFFKVYDDFFQAEGFEVNHMGLFCANIPLRTRQQTGVLSSKRSLRRALRHQFKERIKKDVFENMTKYKEMNVAQLVFHDFSEVPRISMGAQLVEI